MITAKEASALRIHNFVEPSPIQRVLSRLEEVIRTAAPNWSCVSEIFRMSDSLRDEVLAELTKLGFDATAFPVGDSDERYSWYSIEVRWPDKQEDAPAIIPAKEAGGRYILQTLTPATTTQVLKQLNVGVHEVSRVRDFYEAAFFMTYATKNEVVAALTDQGYRARAHTVYKPSPDAAWFSVTVNWAALA